MPFKKNILFLFLLLFSGSMMAQKTKGQSREQLETQRLSILEEIKRTTVELSELRKDKKASLSELQALQSKLNARQSLISNINNEINIIEENINLANKDVVVLKTQLDTLKKEYAEMVRYTYKNRTSSDMIVFLFAANSFNDISRRLQYVKQYRNYRANQAIKITSAGKQLNNKITVLNQEKQKKDFVLMAQEQQSKMLEAETAEKDRVVSELKGKEKDLLNGLAKNKKAADDLNRAISNAIQREIEIARKRVQEERAQQEKIRKAQQEQERKLAQQKKVQQAQALEKLKREEEAKRLELVKKQQLEKERQALADKQRREEQERKLVQERQAREAKEQALALERKKQEEAERRASKMAEAQRVEQEKQLAIERKKQEDRQQALLVEKQKQDERQRQLLAEKQRQEERQRQLIEDKKKQERDQARLVSTQPFNNPRYIKSLAEKQMYDGVALNTGTSDKGTPSNSNTVSETVADVKKSTTKTFTSDDYKYSLTPVERSLASNFEASKGHLPWPVEKGFISEHFGKHQHPLFNKIETENFGMNIKTSRGATARAVFPGEVITVFSVPGAGQNVIVNHGLYYTVYSKLDRVTVSKGMKIGAKQSIGSVATDEDGNAVIHFEVWKVGANGKSFKINPEQWVAQ